MSTSRMSSSSAPGSCTRTSTSTTFETTVCDQCGNEVHKDNLEAHRNTICNNNRINNNTNNHSWKSPQRTMQQNFWNESTATASSSSSSSSTSPVQSAPEAMEIDDDDDDDVKIAAVDTSNVVSNQIANNSAMNGQEYVNLNNVSDNNNGNRTRRIRERVKDRHSRSTLFSRTGSHNPTTNTSTTTINGFPTRSEINTSTSSSTRRPHIFLPRASWQSKSPQSSLSNLQCNEPYSVEPTSATTTTATATTAMISTTTKTAVSDTNCAPPSTVPVADAQLPISQSRRQRVVEFILNDENDDHSWIRCINGDGDNDEDEVEVMVEEPDEQRIQRRSNNRSRSRQINSNRVSRSINSNDNNSRIRNVAATTGGVPIDVDAIEVVDEEWSCSRCTLLNSVAKPYCDACGNRNRSIAAFGGRSGGVNVRRPDPTGRARFIGLEEDGDDDNLDVVYYTDDSDDEIEGGRASSRFLTSSFGLMGSGALMGGVLGTTGAYLRGRSLMSGAVEGVVSGAVGGALVREALEPTLASGATASSVAASNNGRANSTSERRSHRATGRRNDGQQQHHGRPSSNSRAGSTAATRAMTRNSRRRTTRSGDGRSSNNNNNISRSRFARAMGATDDPLFDLMMQIINNEGMAMQRRGATNVDRMTYEQILQVFGDGTENMGTSSEVISSLPVTILKDPIRELPEGDHRKCSICLEDFQSGEERMTLPCLHGYHEQCATKWLLSNGSCPICKHKVSNDNHHEYE